MIPEQPTNGWTKYEQLVLTQLHELKADVKELREDMSALKTSMAVTKFKLALIGTIAGMVGSGIVFAFAGHLK